jgi:hypothetical protein
MNRNGMMVIQFIALSKTNLYSEWRGSCVKITSKVRR